MNRLEVIRWTSSPTKNMGMVLDALDVTDIVPTPNKYYTYIYRAKTPNIMYDAHPFIVCTTVFNWGFIGFNFHWNEYRQYSWGEVMTNLFEVYDEELNTMERAPTAKFQQS